MPGTKRKVDEDTWMVSQSKKFKSGVSLANVYETTLAHLRVGGRNFFNTLMGSSPRTSPSHNSNSSRATSPIPSGSSGGGGGSAPPSPGYNVSPGSPLVRDLISDNELQSPRAASPVVMVRPARICQECVTRRGMGVGNEEAYGKCSYCDKLVCHLNSCRGCGNEFCGECSIPKYDDSSADSFECYNCLH